MRLLLLLVLLCAQQIAYSQTIDCLPPATRIRIADSLRALPEVRLEALQARLSSNYYKHAADSLWLASTLSMDAVHATERAFEGQVLLTANEVSKVNVWKAKAQRRGWLNVLLATAGAGLIYSFSTR